ncbi:hypothetical protein AYJ09_01445 [Candidatus Liberibacter solanacearum]|uniref:hypothetical protein n=1 Tax=Candidatus Liberibacter solanacearum TaxID=556287 RepID=UPI000978DE48|nr:hypothetical protein [Candidatus Liberibacter solanacearum]ONI59077.1 hypothetical protein AYJ09_01445 [Candidatus Liberibacter solanacearum]
MTECEICNWALLKLGQRPLTTLDGRRLPPNALLCNTLLKPIHWSLLRSFAWSFATQSALLSPLALGGKEVRYSLPKKCLKVLKIDRKGELMGDCIVVQAKTSSPLSIKYIEDVSLEDCDPLYQEALACKLASELCPTLTADNQLTLRLKGEFEELKKGAVDMDGIEIPEEREY